MRLDLLALLAICLGCADRGAPGEKATSQRQADTSQAAASGADSTRANTFKHWNWDDSASDAEVRRDFDESVANIRAAVAHTGLDSTYTAPLLDRLALSDSVWRELRPVPKVPDTAFAAVLERWFAGSKGLPNDRRAAAYVAADQLLAVGFATLRLWDSTEAAATLRDEINALGADIGWHESDAEFAYMHSWLAEAIRIDPNGPTGIEARFWRLAHWCEAGRGGDQAREARADAEDLLARNLSPVQLARAHYYAGEASRDLVTFAHPHKWVFVDTALYARGEDEARQAAITHYRAALALDSTSENAVDAAAQLRLLLSDRSPEAVRFGCWQGE